MYQKSFKSVVVWLCNHKKIWILALEEMYARPLGTLSIITSVVPCYKNIAHTQGHNFYIMGEDSEVVYFEQKLRKLNCGADISCQWFLCMLYPIKSAVKNLVYHFSRQNSVKIAE